MSHDTEAAPTRYAQIGGVDALKVAVDDFYVRVLGDPRLAPYFDGVDVGRVKAHQVKLFTGLLGGPDGYDGQGLGAAHARLHIPTEHYQLVVGHLVATLTELGVGDDVIATFGSAAVAVEPEIVDAHAHAHADAETSTDAETETGGY